MKSLHDAAVIIPPRADDGVMGVTDNSVAAGVCRRGRHRSDRMGQRLLTLFVTGLCAASVGAVQLTVDRVEQMPNHPRPYRMRDWAAVARAYDAFVFDSNRQGEHLPLLWWVTTPRNGLPVGFGLPSYVGSAYQTRDDQHEAINCMAAVIGAALVGIDKRHQHGHDFVALCQRYFNSDNGVRLYQNGVNHLTGRTFWYETYPSVLFAQLASLYPGDPVFEQQFQTTVVRMRRSILALRDESGLPDFNHTAFDYQSMRSVDNGRWREPDAAAGYAWLQHLAYARTGEDKYLQAADLCLRFLEGCPDDPFYEVLLPYGAIIAARMNAELNGGYDVRRLLEWCFGPSSARTDWGVIVGRWGAVDVSGLTGNASAVGGYAFAMNTFDMAATLAPLPRYDDRWARTIGKYLLNCANASRLFYASAHDDAHQSSAAWARRYDPGSCISYEGCRRFGRRNAMAVSETTLVGEVVRGDFLSTQKMDERPHRLEETLRESVVGDHDELQHIWALKLPAHRSAWLGVRASVPTGEGNGEAFQFSYACTEGGPYVSLVTVRPGAKRGQRLGARLPQTGAGMLYVKVDDSDRSSGRRQRDTLRLVALYVCCELDVGPFAMGDALSGDPRDIATDLALYGASHVGYLGGIVQTTEVDEILKIDLCKTDWAHAPAYPTYLLFNPYDGERRVMVDVGSARSDLYETVSETFLARAVTGRAPVSIPPDSAVVVVACPGGAKVEDRGDRVTANGIVIDYRRPTITAKVAGSEAPLRGRAPIRVHVETPRALSLESVAVELDDEEIYRAPAPPAELAVDVARHACGRHLLTATVTAGGVTDRCTVPLVFDTSQPVYHFGPNALADWADNAYSFAKAIVSDGRVAITAKRGAWGAVVSDTLDIDFDRRPAIFVEVDQPEPRWVLKLRIIGGGDYYVQPDTNRTGVIFLDLLSAIRRRNPLAQVAGRKRVRLLLGAAGKSGARASFGGLRIAYQSGP